jgi:hypothetical protein
VENRGVISGGTFTGTVNNESIAIFNPSGTSGNGKVSIAALSPSDKSELTPIVYEKGSTATATQVSAEFNMQLEYVQQVSLTAQTKSLAGTGTAAVSTLTTNEPITSATTKATLYDGKGTAVAELQKSSTIITFYQSYLDTLEPGTYTVTINYGRNINGEFTFTVTAPEEEEYVAPDTGVKTASSSGCWGIVFLISLGTAALCILRKRQMN